MGSQNRLNAPTSSTAKCRNTQLDPNNLTARIPINYKQSTSNFCLSDKRQEGHAGLGTSRQPGQSRVIAEGHAGLGTRRQPGEDRVIAEGNAGLGTCRQPGESRVITIFDA